MLATMQLERAPPPGSNPSPPSPGSPRSATAAPTKGDVGHLLSGGRGGREFETSAGDVGRQLARTKKDVEGDGVAVICTSTEWDERNREEGGAREVVVWETRGMTRDVGGVKVARTKLVGEGGGVKEKERKASEGMTWLLRLTYNQSLSPAGMGSYV